MNKCISVEGIGIACVTWPFCLGLATLSFIRGDGKGPTGDKMIGTLCKTRRQRERERHQTKVLAEQNNDCVPTL